MKLNVLTQSFFDLLFPHYCVGCDKQNVLVCQDCLGGVSFAEQICFICKSISQKGFVHDECARRLNIPYYPTQILSACSYQSQLAQDLIHGLKYDGLLDGAKPCAEILAQFLRSQRILFSDKWVLTYVPLDQRKMNTRGFNQSELIARELSKIIRVPVEKLLIKSQSTKPQMKLSRQERLKNVKDAFETTKSPLPHKKIILLDDVVTTGSTLLECSKALSKAGAEEIIWLTLARD